MQRSFKRLNYKYLSVFPLKLGFFQPLRNVPKPSVNDYYFKLLLTVQTSRFLNGWQMNDNWRMKKTTTVIIHMQEANNFIVLNRKTKE